MIMSEGVVGVGRSTDHLPAARQVKRRPFHTWEMSCHMSHTFCAVYISLPHDVLDMTCVYESQRTEEELHAPS